MTVKSLELRDYQEESLQKITSMFSSGIKELVLSIYPSGGKTETLKHHIKRNPKAKYLILPHGTTLMRLQWEEELLLSGIRHSKDFGQTNVCLNLPQSLHNKELGEVDYLVIDEAHEFTFADMISKIKIKTRPKHIIYLTGTPSKFIARKTPIILVPASEGIARGYSSDLYVSMLSTCVKLLESDYNLDGDIQGASETKLERGIDEDMDNLLKAIHKRICETGLIKGSPRLRGLLDWAPTLGALHKTMIACRSIKQSQLVLNYFERQGIPVISSESTNDPESLNISRFINEDDLKVLVVVDRGTLGFNMPNLVNIVDFTNSRNIDRIYQLYARVMRVHPDHKMKYFFKFSPELQMHINKDYMNAALMMMFKEFIERYDGKNVKSLNVLMKRLTKNSDDQSKNPKSGKKNNGEYFVPFDSELKKMVCELLNDIKNQVGQVSNEYAYTTLGEINEKRTGIQENIQDYLNTYGLADQDNVLRLSKIVVEEGVSFPEAHRILQKIS